MRASQEAINLRHTARARILGILYSRADGMLNSRINKLALENSIMYTKRTGVDASKAVGTRHKGLVLCTVTGILLNVEDSLISKFLKINSDRIERLEEERTASQYLARMFTLCKTTGDFKFLMPEEVFRLIGTYTADGELAQLTEEKKAQFELQNASHRDLIRNRMMMNLLLD